MKLPVIFLPLFIVLFSLTACSTQDPAIAQVNAYIKAHPVDQQQSDWKTKLSKPEQLTFNEKAKYFWQLETSEGNLTIALFADIAPMHVSSTIYLTTLGFYDNLIFHRVIPGFMAQGGDPLGVGRGNPGYRYEGEFSDNEKASHSKAGILSMANAGPNTDGSQFFITFAQTQFLDGRHTVFGEVVEGLTDVLPKLEALGSRSGKPTKEIKIIKATIRVE